MNPTTAPRGRVPYLLNRAFEMIGTTELPDSLRDATEHQPAARAALAAALPVPVHAYLFAGPPGAGKRRAARAFAAELLAQGAEAPDDARRRALADPSPHPDLVWLAPRGTQHLVDEVRQRVITSAAYRPFEGARRVFVIEAADAMADESQNALLKTLEEPAEFVHIILISAEPELLAETVRSRCQEVRFRPLDAEAVAAGLASRGSGESDAERLAAARLSGGDPRRAEFLVSPEGRELRAVAAACVGAALSGELEAAPWRRMLAAAESAGARAGEATVERLATTTADAGQARRRAAREAEEAGRRASRRARTEALDTGLGLLAAWLRDLAAVADGAADLVLNSDRTSDLRSDAAELDARAARRGAELVMDTRRRLQVNVGEELALEALVYRLEALPSASRACA
jgi:DNA polymerase-3 subunit delta'